MLVNPTPKLFNYFLSFGVPRQKIKIINFIVQSQDTSLGFARISKLLADTCLLTQRADYHLNAGSFRSSFI